jgi:hypothetical protein
MAEQKAIFEVSKYPVKDTDEVANGVIDVMAYWHEKLHRSKIIFYFRRERHGSFCRIFSAY